MVDAATSEMLPKNILGYRKPRAYTFDPAKSVQAIYNNDLVDRANYVRA
jgi:hypothetical protein